MIVNEKIISDTTRLLADMEVRADVLNGQLKEMVQTMNQLRQVVMAMKSDFDEEEKRHKLNLFPSSRHNHNRYDFNEGD